MLREITPVILTFDEAPNIARTLARLEWARDIVIVDSGSTDGTLEIVASCPRVRLFRRAFDSHAAQWSYAITATDIRTEWVLALDADHVLTDALVEELDRLRPGHDVSGFEASFVYCVRGTPLRATLYPPATVLYRRQRAAYVQDGHTQRARIAGAVARLAAPLLHDDRKPARRWLAAQRRYMRMEAEKIRTTRSSSLGWPGRLRKLRIVAPAAVALYCLFAKGLLLDGRAGLLYTAQRVYAELLLSAYLLRGDLGGVPAAKQDR